jgi:TetR/AcrR family transcriptional regulator
MDNRSKILEVALELFSKKGYEAVGVQEIVEAAGVTKPTLYHYFGNKMGVFSEVVTRHSRPFYDTLKEAAEYGGDLPLTLLRVAQTYFQFAMKSPRFYRLQLLHWFSPDESEADQLVHKQWMAQHTLFVEMFEKASQDHGNMRGRSHPYAVTFLGTINSYIGIYLNGQVTLDQELAFRATHQFMHGIYS